MIALIWHQLRSPASAARNFAGAMLGVCLATAGCQHHRANQYAYAPPLAPAVYPQPQAGSGPVVFPAPPALPAGPLPAGAPPVGSMPPGTVMPAPVAAGQVPQPAGMVSPQAFVVPDGQPCPPCHEGGMPVGAVYYGEGQSPPCP